MKKSKLLRIALVALIAALLCGTLVFAVSADGTEATAKTVYDYANDEDGLKILCIGNSYSKDTTNFVPEILMDLGIRNFQLGHLYIASCSAMRHYANLIGDPTIYPEMGVQNYQYKLHDGTKWTFTNEYPIKDAIQSDNWDFIVIQQKLADVVDTEPDWIEYYGKLVKEVKKYQPDATYVWNMTWAGSESRTDNKQMEVYEQIASNTPIYYSAGGEVSFVNPIATAIQNARSSSLGDTLNRDGAHLTYGVGCYTAGLTFAGSITGLDVSNVTWRPTEDTTVSDPITEEEQKIAIESAVNALKTPFAVTQSKYIPEEVPEPEGAVYKLTYKNKAVEYITQAQIDAMKDTETPITLQSVVNTENLKSVKCYTDHTVSSLSLPSIVLDLQGHTLSGTKIAPKTAANTVAEIRNGTLAHTGGNFVYMTALTTDRDSLEAMPTLVIAKCEINCVQNFAQIRDGNLIIKESSNITNSTAGANIVLIHSQSSSASFTIQDSTANISSRLIAVNINAGDREKHVTIENSNINTGTKELMSFTDNTTAKPANTIAKVKILGDETKLSFSQFIYAQAKNDTPEFTFEYGVMMSGAPNVVKGTTQYMNEGGETVETGAVIGSGDSTYPYIVSAVPEKAYYVITKSDGKVEYITDESVTFADVVKMENVKSVVCYTNPIISEIISLPSIVIDLNENELTQAGSYYLQVPEGNTAEIRNGILTHTTSYLVNMGGKTTTPAGTLIFDNCQINASIHHTFVIYNGNVAVKNSTITGTGTKNRFAWIHNGSNAGLTLENSDVNIKNTFAYIQRTADPDRNENCELTIKDSTVTTTTNILSFSSPTTNNGTIAVNVLGESKLSFGSFIGTQATSDIPVYTFGVGVMVTDIPNIEHGKTEYTGGAEGFTSSGDETYKYEVVEVIPLPVKPQFALTLYTDFSLNLCFSEEDAAKVVSVKVGNKEIAPIVDKNIYIYRIEGISPQNAANAQKIELVIDNEGTTLNKTIEYSIIDYANALLASDYSDESKQLICRAVDYIKAVHDYTATEIPTAVAELLENTNYIPISENATEVPAGNINVEALKPFLKGAKLKPETGVKFRFFLQDNIGSGELTVSSKTEKATYTVENSLIDGNNYFDVNMRAFDLYDGAVTLTFGDNTGSYDFKTYANSDDVKNDSNENIGALMLALYNYFREANEYMQVADKDFKSTASVVVKDGKSATVTYTFDDGFQSTASRLESMLADYDNLKLTFALIPGFAHESRNLVTLNTAYNEETGKYEYVLDENGNYTYTINEENVAFWQELLKDANGRIEYSSHSLTHAYPGANDEGGEFTYNSGGTVKKVTKPVGSVTAEYYAAVQVFKDLFGVDVRTICKPGVSANEEDEVVDGVLCQGYYQACLEVFERMYNEGLLVGIRGGSYSLKANQDVEDWKKYIDDKSNDGGWALFLIHQVIPDDQTTTAHHILETQARELFAYTNSDKYWVSTLEEACKYYAEWETAEVESKCLGDKITLTVTDKENNEVYDEALTVKVTVPSSWRGCAVNGEALEIMTDENGEKFVYVNVVPDSGIVEIIKN